MPSRRVQSSTQSDADLIARVRRGDQAAFGELYRRHHRAARTAARTFRGLDPDDLVDEAFLRIVVCIRSGKGPREAFRPYLYRTIHNVAVDWLRAPPVITVADDAEWEALESHDCEFGITDPTDEAIERTLTARAYRSLPDRWQAVLWYTEVEGMDPHEVAPLLGLTANGVAALAYRARDGLRTAWLQAHVTSDGLSGECRWAAERTARGARGGLRETEARRLRDHRSTCARCAIVAEEVDDLGARLALTVVPLVLGGVAGAAWITSRATGEVAAVSGSTAIAAPPDVSLLLGGASAGSAVGAGASTVAALTAPALVLGSLVVVTLDVTAPEPTPISAAAPASTTHDQNGMLDHDGGLTLPGDLPVDGDHSATAQDDDATQRAAEDGPDVDTPSEPSSPADNPDGVTALVERETEALKEVVDGALSTVIGGDPPAGHTAPGGVVGADLALDLSGTATPGAAVSLQAAGQIYATTTVAADGTFTLHATALPSGIERLELVQAVDRAYLQRLVPGAGRLLGGVLGSLDAALEALIAPVSIVTQSATGIAIDVGP